MCRERNVRGGVNELRLDPLSGRWVAISMSRADRPDAFALSGTSIEDTRPLPVLPGSRGGQPARPRDLRPDREVAGPGGAQPVPGLRGRPALRRREPRARCSPRPRRAGSTRSWCSRPSTRTSWAELSDEQAGLVMAAIRDRIEEHSQQSQPPLQPGHRELRPGGGRLARASPRPAPRDVLRAPGALRGAGRVRPVRRRLPAVHDGRRRGERRLPGRLRRRAGRRRLPVLERGPLRDAGHPPGPHPASLPEPHRGPGVGGQVAAGLPEAT